MAPNVEGRAVPIGYEQSRDNCHYQSGAGSEQLDLTKGCP
jgi:hypothetical protein